MGTVLLEGCTVEAIICSLNEARYIADTLESALHQNLIEDNLGKVFITVADSSSTDGTPEIARSYSYDNVNVLNVEKGKLNAKDYAIRNSSADIIISLDADSIYPYEFFAMLVRHFADPHVVGVQGVLTLKHPFYNIVERVISRVSTGIFAKLSGCGSAFRRGAYLATGGFDLSIDQKDIWQVLMEEEYAFASKLRKLGEVVYDPDATFITSDRRWTSNPQMNTRGAYGKDTF